MGRWEMVRLGDVVAKAITGEWGTECARDEKGTNILRTTNFTNLGVINFSNVVTRNIPEIKVQKKKLEKNDIILEKSGGSDNQPVGRVVFFDRDDGEVYLCNNFTQVLRIEQSVAVSRYIFLYLYYLHQNGTTELLQNKTTGIRNLQVKKYMELEVPLPPLLIQQRIADVLDRASALIEKRKAQIDKLDVLVKSQFIEMFGDPVKNPMGWKMCHLCHLGEWASGGTPSRADSKYFQGDINWYSAGELNELILRGSIEKISRDAIKNTSAKLFPANSLFVGMYDTAAFKLAITPIIASSNQACANINPDISKTNVYWLYYNLQSMKPYFLERRRGIRQKNLNLGMIKNFLVPLPPLTLQDKFADFVHQVEAQKQLLQSSLAKLELQYKSLMQKCFRGELF